MQAAKMASIAHEELTLENITFSPTIRLLDPNGRVFFHDGNVYRGIYDERVEFVNALFDNGIVESLVQKQLLVGTSRTNLKLPGFGLILKHEVNDLVTLPEELSIESLRLAALATLNLMTELHLHGLTLVDGHNRNISMAPGGSMVWHDFGSIIELKDGVKPAIGEFLTNFYFPLRLYQKTGSTSLIRRLGMHCSQDEYARLNVPKLAALVDRISTTSGGAKIGRILRKGLARYGTRRLGPVGQFRAMLRRSTGECKTASSARSLQRILRLCGAVKKMKFRNLDTTWGKYHSPDSIESVMNAQSRAEDPRFQAIEALVAEAKPDRVLDIGANQGLYSHMAYRYSDSVISADYDERAVGKHVELLGRTNGNHRIYPIVLNAVEVNQEVASRVRSHTVMALALTHHLRLGQRFPFSFIAKQLSSVTGKRLITEFMPNGLGGLTGPRPNPLPEDYKLEDFLNALREEFHSVKVVEYEQPAGASPRTLVVCDKHTVCS